MDSADFTCLINSLTSFRELRETCVRHYRALGAVLLSYHHLPPIGATGLSDAVTVSTDGFPADVVESYRHREYHKVDPVIRIARQATHPFRWSDAMDLPDLSEGEQAYIDDFMTGELGDGVAIPVFGPLGRNGYNGMGYGKGNPPFSERTVAELQLSAQAAHLQYCHLLMARAPSNVTLSAREREVLMHLSSGYSKPQIAEAARLSQNTVDTYVRRIFEKLDVSDRTTAILRAMALGLIA
ncbi:MAG: autoinducer binding domain-containing protein [Henriciella sp.]